MSAIDRRTVLIGLGAAGASMLLPAGATQRVQAAAVRALTAAVADRAAAQSVGRLWLHEAPAPGAADLVSALCAALDTTPQTLGRLPRADVAARLEQRIRADYRSGLTVSLRGWMLSLTEARLSALVAVTRA